MDASTFSVSICTTSLFFFFLNRERNDLSKILREGSDRVRPIQPCGWKFGVFPLYHLASDSYFYGILQFKKPLLIVLFKLSFIAIQCVRWNKNWSPHFTDDKPDMRKRTCPHGTSVSVVIPT